MATRGNIIVQRGPQDFAVIYTHSDGYPSYMGVFLNRFHNTYEAAKEIVSNGACSFIDVRLTPEPGESHHFDHEKRAPFCSVFYTRDRGEKLAVDTFDSLEKALAFADNEWVYVWLNQTYGWLFSEVMMDEHDGGWTIVTEPKHLSPVADFIATDEKCLKQIDDLNDNGMTLEWRDAGCPHAVVEGKYGPQRIPCPIYEDGTVPVTYDFGVMYEGTAWERDVGLQTIHVVGVVEEIEEAPAPEPTKKRRVAKKADKRGFAYENPGAWA